MVGWSQPRLTVGAQVQIDQASEAVEGAALDGGETCDRADEGEW